VKLVLLVPLPHPSIRGNRGHARSRSRVGRASSTPTRACRKQKKPTKPLYRQPRHLGALRELQSGRGPPRARVGRVWHPRFGSRAAISGSLRSSLHSWFRVLKRGISRAPFSPHSCCKRERERAPIAEDVGQDALVLDEHRILEGLAALGRGEGGGSPLLGLEPLVGEEIVVLVFHD